MTVLLRCDEPGCEVTRPHPGALTAHLVEDHSVGAGVALRRAQAVQAKLDPFGLDANDVKRHEAHPNPARTASAADAPVSGNPQGTVLSTAAVLSLSIEEPAMPAKKHGPDPKNCKLCARLSKKSPGLKCKRHGGPGRSTSNRGRGPKPATGGGSRSTRKGATVRGNGLPSFEAALTFLDTQIGQAEERLARLKAARDGMAMLVDASRA